MTRGGLVTVVTSGGYGKPHLARIVQADAYAEHPSPTVLPLTSGLRDLLLLRIAVEPGAGLPLRSQVMVGKAATIPRAEAGNRTGRVNAATLSVVGQTLAAFLGIG